MKVQALFKGGAKAAPAKKAASKASKPSKSSSGKKSGGWLGSDSQNLGLDKYVACLRLERSAVFRHRIRTCTLSSLFARSRAAQDIQRQRWPRTALMVSNGVL
jgi:hypothetical protein